MPIRGPGWVLRRWRELRRRRPGWLAVAAFAVALMVVALVLQGFHLRGW
jgi:hypothetical protein